MSEWDENGTVLLKENTLVAALMPPQLPAPRRPRPSGPSRSLPGPCYPGAAPTGPLAQPSPLRPPLRRAPQCPSARPGRSTGRRRRRRGPARRSRCGGRGRQGGRCRVRGGPTDRAGPDRTALCRRRCRRSPRPEGGCGLGADEGLTPKPGERNSITGYLEEPAEPRRATFPGPRFWGGPPELHHQCLQAAPAAAAAGSPAVLRAANKAGPRRKRLARGLPFTPRRDQPRTEPTRLPKNGIPGNALMKSRATINAGKLGGTRPAPAGSDFGSENMEGEKRKVPFVPPAAAATPRLVRAQEGGAPGRAPSPAPATPAAAPRLPLVCTRLIRSGNSFPFL
ncbi:translation initiation factor IF-2-like [Chiroxiphia lanceolata]|uniref:translation initiation factor IF-2-like n=1 Tax=Chiroxiphia lanceolata TaxID=296741 RepID=UPI0013CE87A0|nr:translation initiation factor IF-2-like [Chiroxiphia lanceolata]